MFRTQSSRKRVIMGTQHTCASARLRGWRSWPNRLGGIPHRWGGSFNVHALIRGPAIGEDLPSASRLADQNDQIFSTLFAALSHCARHEHLATSQIESNIAQHFEPQ